MDKLLQGQVGIITGSAGGVGSEVVKLFSKNGATINMIGRTKAPLEKLKNDIGGNYYLCDVTNEKQIDSCTRNILDTYGKIDFLINCAGTHLPEKQNTQMDYNQMEEIFRTNVFGSLLFAKHVLRPMRKQKNGNIVNISSILGSIGAENMTIYSASKGAIISATRSMAIENAKYGIRINCISPTATRTPMLNAILNQNPDLEQRLISSHPTDELCTPQQVAKSILYLASELSSGLIGHNLILDNGRSIYDH